MANPNPNSQGPRTFPTHLIWRQSPDRDGMDDDSRPRTPRYSMNHGGIVRPWTDQNPPPPMQWPVGSDNNNNTADPSVEKAYYRKCIELKRRLNEVEAANDEAKLRRVRLDRGIMKMRLERAYLLEELRKRMEANVEESEGSGEETMASPPADRPHRDKRRRHNPPTQPSGTTAPNPQPPTEVSRQPSDPQHVKREFAHIDTVPSQPYSARGSTYMPPPEYGAPAQQQPPAPPSSTYNQSSPYAAQPPRPAVGGPRSFERRAHAAVQAREMDGGADGDQGSPPVSRAANATGEALGAVPAVREGANGERRVSSGDGGGGQGSGFAAVNN